MDRAKADPTPAETTIHIPIVFRRRRGQRRILVPDGQPQGLPPAEPDSTLTKALARAHRWKGLLENGDYTSITELAAAEKINASYLCRVLRLTLLAPDIVEGILDGRLGTVQLDALLKPFPPDWNLQRQMFAAGH